MYLHIAGTLDSWGLGGLAARKLWNQPRGSSGLSTSLKSIALSLRERQERPEGGGSAPDHQNPQISDHKSGGGNNRQPAITYICIYN